MHQIERGIYYEDSYLGVTLGGLVFSHGIIMIDAPLRAEEARSWRSTLINQRGGANRLLVTLDAHPDRTLGARTLDCTVVAHQKTAQVFRNRPTIFKGQSIETGAAWETYEDAVGMRWASPDITFTQRMSLHWGGPEVILEHHPGVAQGAIWAILPTAKVVFVGDTVVVNQPPFLANAELDEWLVALDLLMTNYRDYVIISGRGGPAAPESLKGLSKFLKNLEKSLDRLARQNISPEETEGLIPSLMSEFTFPPERYEIYEHRLRYGLYQYFARRFRSVNTFEQERIEDSEQ